MAQEEDAELLALQRIDDTSVKLQQEGKYLEALECMERGLVLRQHFFGADSEEVWRACKTVGEMCNLLAMTYLQQEDFAMVLELLKKADILTERDPPGRAVTYNNLACYYRRQGKLHAALSYLQKSLKIEAGLSSDDVENPADTHLNMCAVLSQLGRHQSALEHAQSALILLQEELFGGMNAGGDAPQKADRVAVLAIAYHNIGVEQEFLKKFQQSVASYGKGVEVAKTHLGPSHGITITLKNSLIAARRAISAKKGPKKSGTTRRKKGGRGVGRPMNPSDSNVEKWGNITGVYGDIPGVKGVEKQKKSTRGKRRKHRPGASTPTAGSTGARGSVAAPPPQGDEPGASQQMLDMVTPRRGEPDDEGGAGEGGPTYGSVAAEESKRGADFEFPSFPGSCSSLLAKHLTREVYDELVMVATPQGHTLGDLCRQGVRNPSLAPLPGHAAALGVAAPDADAYDVFAPLLAPILEEHHAGANLAKANHVSSAAALDASHVTLPPEATAGAVSAASVLVCRNVAGEPFLPVLGREGRQRVESAVLAALEGGGIAGTYIPLAEIDDAGDVGARALSAFGRAGISLDAPSPNDAASGAGSEWPTNRGVFVCRGAVFVGINIREHVAVVDVRHDGDVLAALQGIAEVVGAMAKSVTWAFNDRFGSLTSDATLLGAATIVSASVDESAVAPDTDVAEVAATFGLAATSTAGHLRLWTLSGMNVGAATCTEQFLQALATLLGGAGAGDSGDAAGAAAAAGDAREGGDGDGEGAGADDSAPAADASAVDTGDGRTAGDAAAPGGDDAGAAAAAEDSAQ